MIQPFKKVVKRIAGERITTDMVNIGFMKLPWDIP
jgi:hypothetical protein